MDPEMAEPQPKYGLEIGIMAVAVVIAIIALYIYVKFSPAEKNIPPEYFFKGTMFTLCQKN